MQPLGELGFAVGGAGACELTFPCELCVCENNVQI